MPPDALSPLQPLERIHAFDRAASIYAPRKPRRTKSTRSKSMLDSDLPIKPTLTPFHPLPAIGQKKNDNKVIVFDFNKNERPATVEDRPLKLHDLLKPLTPLRIRYRKSSLDSDDNKPQQLLRENTYDLIEPIILTAAKVKKKDPAINRRNKTVSNTENNPLQTKVSPKTRFRNAALQVVKLSSVTETGKLLCLRERETMKLCSTDDDESVCRLQELPRSPAQKLTKLSEIFQSLEVRGRYRDKMKKENSWF